MRDELTLIKKGINLLKQEIKEAIPKNNASAGELGYYNGLKTALDFIEGKRDILSSDIPL